MNAIRNNKDKPLTSLEVNAISVMLKEYLLIGGMPAAVLAYLKNKDYKDVRPVQLELLEDYRVLIKDKFTQALGQRCKRIWKSSLPRTTRSLCIALLILMQEVENIQKQPRPFAIWE